MNRLVGGEIIDYHVQIPNHASPDQGIVNGEDFQIVFSDTPGVVKPSYKMQGIHA